ncbi:low temperature requirement protein A [Nocardia anaemiae]|uniref:low temperature requirement protein A n=1 Tax=Nocardia anaemiae TaxID=263910 RepID=UPI0007A52072|nr:low temperature requirement protein A [Nocardia anaemiae]
MSEPADSSTATPHARATWAELFFDLVLVFAVTQTAHVLGHHTSIGTLGHALVLLAPLWWGWVGVTILVNTVEENNTQRLVLFGSGLCIFLMAVAAPAALDQPRSAAMIFAGSHLVLRIILFVAVTRTNGFATTINPFSIGLVTGIAIFASAPLPEHSRIWVWTGALVVQLGAPLLYSKALRNRTIGVSHLSERFGLFIIIALGESVVDAGAQASSTGLGPAVVTTLVLAFAVGAGLWWIYFHRSARLIEHALSTMPSPGLIVRDVLSYGHFALVTGLVAVAVGLGHSVADPGHTAHGVAAGLAPGGAALFMLALVVNRWRMLGNVATTRAIPVIALITIALTSSLLPAIAVVALTAAVLVTANIVEQLVAPPGRPLPAVSVGRRRSR